MDFPVSADVCGVFQDPAARRSWVISVQRSSSWSGPKWATTPAALRRPSCPRPTRQRNGWNRWYLAHGFLGIAYITMHNPSFMNCFMVVFMDLVVFMDHIYKKTYGSYIVIYGYYMDNIWITYGSHVDNILETMNHGILGG